MTDSRPAPRWRVTREQSDDLGFALTCLTAWAVDLDEFKVWVYRVIVDSDELHEHLLDMGDAHERFDVTLRRQEIIGWSPSWSPSRRQRHAIDGIAYARVPGYRSDAVDRDAAIDALSRSPEIVDRFRRFFPGVDIPGIA